MWPWRKNESRWVTGSPESEKYRSWLRTLERHQMRNLERNFSEGYPNIFTKTKEEYLHKRWCILQELDRRGMI